MKTKAKHTCQKCKSERITSVSAKCSDMCGVWMVNTGQDQSDYVPKDMGFYGDGYGDYVEFELCLDCGQMQGRWPRPRTALEKQKPATQPPFTPVAPWGGA